MKPKVLITLRIPDSHIRSELFEIAEVTRPEHFTGAMSNVSRLVIIENDRKTEPSDPDGYAYIVPNRGPQAVRLDK